MEDNIIYSDIIGVSMFADEFHISRFRKMSLEAKKNKQDLKCRQGDNSRQPFNRREL